MAEDDLALVAKGQERQTVTLRAKVYWALVAMAVMGAVPGLVLSASPKALWVSLGFVLAAAVASIWVADYIMVPIAVLKRRLEVKNYGEQAPEEPSPDATPEDDGFELAAFLLAGTQTRNVDINAGLPVELAAIERLVRAGRVSEIAMETVKRDLFRHLSHQLKSPLALIQAHSRSATNGLEEGDAETVRRSLHSIDALGANISGLVEQMLSMAWVEALVEQGLAGRKANVSAAIMELIDHRERALQERHMRVESQVEAGLWVRGQHELLQEMVASLLDNAIRYAPEGTTITVEAKRLASTRTLFVTVLDRGPGIPVQQRERVFEPFYGSIGLDARGIMTYGTRRHRALGEGVSKSSHGLGLALVRAVAKLHGATVTLESGPGGVGLLARILLTAADPPDDDALQSDAVPV